MSHLTIPQLFITCHHSAVRSTLQHYHLTPYRLPAHDALSLDCQVMMGLYLDCQLMMNLTICDCDFPLPVTSYLYINPCTFDS